MCQKDDQDQRPVENQSSSHRVTPEFDDEMLENEIDSLMDKLTQD